MNLLQPCITKSQNISISNFYPERSGFSIDSHVRFPETMQWDAVIPLWGFCCFELKSHFEWSVKHQIDELKWKTRSILAMQTLHWADEGAKVSSCTMSEELCFWHKRMIIHSQLGHSVGWRDLFAGKQISLLEIISTATVLLAMVVESSRACHVVG